MSNKNEIKPTDIFDVLDLAKKARDLGLRFTPCFAGDAGVGKSEICQQWVKEQQKTNPEFKFIDKRIALLEPPDFIGLPKLIDVEGKTRTSHVLPDFWPTEGEGLLLFEEPNRANTSMMNCMMQILTDRAVDKYKLPDGWIMAAAINPDGQHYDVNSMDIALKDRFEIYDVGYKFEVFRDFMKENDWHPHIQSFVKSGIWLFKKPEELMTTGSEEAKYISPRTWSKLNTALMCGVDKNPTLYYSTILSNLGTQVGREFYKFVSDNKPVLAQDFINNKKDAMKRLKVISDKEGYRGDLINIVIDSVSDAYEQGIDDDTILEIVKIIPKDQSVNLLKACVMKSKVKDKDLNYFVKLDPKLKDILKSVLRG